jgi:hypothetical protein
LPCPSHPPSLDHSYKGEIERQSMCAHNTTKILQNCIYMCRIETSHTRI